MGMCFLPGPRSLPYWFKQLGAGTPTVLGDGVWTTASDKNLKMEKYELNPQVSFEALIKLRPLVYEWREGTSQRIGAGNTPSLGFFAQEVEEIQELKALVGRNTDGTYSMNYHALTAPLVSAMQHVNAELAYLKREYQELKTNHHDAVNQLMTEQYQNNELLKKQVSTLNYLVNGMEHRVKAISPNDPTSHYQSLKSDIETMKKSLHADVVRLENLGRVLQKNLQTKIEEAKNDVEKEVGIMKCNVTNLTRYVYQSRWQRVCGWFRGLFA